MAQQNGDKEVRICIECNVRAATKTKYIALCRLCRTEQKVREKYQLKTRGGGGSGYGCEPGYEPQNKCEPTDAEPGTPEKIEVLQRRAANGEELYHKDDVNYSQPMFESMIEALMEVDEELEQNL